MDFLGYIDLYCWGFGISVSKTRRAIIHRDSGQLYEQTGTMVAVQFLCATLCLIIPDFWPKVS